MFGLYDKDWNLISVFDSDAEAFAFAIARRISPFKIHEL